MIQAAASPVFRLTRAALLGAMTLSLPACALLGANPPPLDTYELTVPAAGADATRGQGRQILVPEPTALKALDGQNIVVKSGPGSIEFLGGAQWSDRLPRVIQSRLAEALQRSGRFGGVGLPGQGLAIDYQVVVEVRAFEVDVSASSQARVGLFVKLLDDRNGSVRASRLFEAAAPLGGGTGNAVYVSALDSAFNTVAADIVAWAASSI